MGEEQREEYQELAMDIFTKQAPNDSRSNRAECASCESMIPDWMNSCPSCQTKFPICIVTGRPLMDPLGVVVRDVPPQGLRAGRHHEAKLSALPRAHQRLRMRIQCKLRMQRTFKIGKN